MENLALENLKNELATIIINMEPEDVFQLNNAFCYVNNCYDDLLYELDDNNVNEILEGKEPIEIIRMTACGDFNYSHDYFRFDGYGNLESLWHITWEIIPELLENIIHAILEAPEEFDMIFEDIVNKVEIATQNEEA
jgi:hypothetical protein